VATLVRLAEKARFALNALAASCNRGWMRGVDVQINRCEPETIRQPVPSDGAQGALWASMKGSGWQRYLNRFSAASPTCSIIAHCAHRARNDHGRDL
jgi:hypothetical protein